MNTERIIDRVRKMLALARDKGATEGERDNALRMAHATIAKYNLDMAAVEATGQKTEVRDFYNSTFFGRPWARRVATACAELFFCEYLYVPATKGKNTTHIFIGKESNALTAASMAEWLVDSIMREGKRYARAQGEGNEAYRTFALGAGERIRTRVRELRNGPVAAPGTGIVLASVYASEQRANRELIAARVRMRSGRTGKGAGSNYGAFLAGVAYGNQVNLDRQVGGTKPKLIGSD